MTAGRAAFPGVSSAGRRCPRPARMAGSACAWGAEPPRFLEAFGRLWQVQSRLGSGSSASVYRVRCCGTPGSPPGALKQFLPPGTTGAAASAAEYGFRKERAALEQLQGHRNIGNTAFPDPFQPPPTPLSLSRPTAPGVGVRLAHRLTVEAQRLARPLLWDESAAPVSTSYFLGCRTPCKENVASLHTSEGWGGGTISRIRGIHRSYIEMLDDDMFVVVWGEVTQNYDAVLMEV